MQYLTPGAILQRKLGRGGVPSRVGVVRARNRRNNLNRLPLLFMTTRCNTKPVNFVLAHFKFLNLNLNLNL